MSDALFLSVNTGALHNMKTLKKAVFGSLFVARLGLVVVCEGFCAHSSSFCRFWGDVIIGAALEG